jgi:hypothetical protein
MFDAAGKILPVLIIPKNRNTVYPPHHDMVKGI